MRVKIRITLDLSLDIPIRQYFFAKLGENNGRVLAVEFTSGGYPFKLSDGVKAILRCAKPDGTYAEKQGRIAEGVAEFELSSRIISVAGSTLCEIQLVLPSGAVAMSPVFEARVAQSIIPADADPPEDMLLSRQYIGAFAVTPFIDGISAALAVELDYPVVYDTWRIYVEGVDIGGAIAKGEPLVTAPMIFDNSNIVIRFERKDKVVMSAEIKALNEVSGMRYGKLISEAN